MPIGSWVAFSIVSVLVILGGFVLGCALDTNHSRLLATSIAVVLVILGLLGTLWYYSNTASGQRAMIDERSDLRNGLDRTIRVYTADGKILSEYKGKIDIEANEGGYIKFDLDGKRYIYYNCFVESIAEIP